MAKTKAIMYMKPFAPYLPYIEEPIRKVSLRDKIMWTAIALLIYLICCQIPLYGPVSQEGSDPLYWLRVILASNRGSLMELGISPLITSSMILQLLAGAKIIDVDQTIKEERELFDGAQKMLGIFITLGEAFAYVLSGNYGDLSQLGAFYAILIIVQLVMAGLTVLLLDDVLQKGYGLQSGISLFIACNMCETILWKSFSPMTMKSEHGTEFEGAIISFFHLLITKPNKISALQQAFYRQSGPNLFNLIATVAIVLVVIYFQGFRVELTLTHKTQRGVRQPYPIKLFYTSNMPIILQTAIISNMFFVSQLLYKNLKSNIIVRLLGTWQEVDMQGHSVPVWGLAYLMSPPRDFFDLISDPFKTLFYIAFVLLMCGFFSRIWIEVSGQGPRDVAKQIDEQGFTLEGHRGGSVAKTLGRYIPIAAGLGGVAIGALSIVADLLGAIGSGTGILLAVTIIYQMFETFTKERAKGESIW